MTKSLSSAEKYYNKKIHLKNIKNVISDLSKNNGIIIVRKVFGH